MKNFKNYLIVFMLGLIIPLILGYLYQVPGLDLSAAKITSENGTALEDAKTKLQNLYDVDVKEYQRLKNLEAKYSKANDILAKMMTIFLADLGLRISNSDIVDMVAQSQAEIPTSSNSSETSERQCPDLPEPKTCPSLSQMAQDEGYKLVRFGSAKDKKWVKNEAKLSELSEADAGSFLKSVEIEDFFNEIRSMKKASDRSWKDLSSSNFEGILTYDNPETASADVNIDLFKQEQNGKMVWNYKISLSRDGKDFSSSSGSGDKILKQTGYSQGIFLDLGGKTGFLQLYFVGGKSTLVGNYYRQTDLSSFKKEGTVKIYRR